MKFSLKCVWCILPPPWLWHRYGNLQTLPSPTQKPTQVSRYWALLSHLGLSPASSFSILSSSSWEGMRSSRPGFGSFTLNLTILAVYQNWWVQPLRCLLCDVFRECAKKRAKKLSCSLLSLGFTPPIQPRKRGWDINSDLWYGSYQQLITVCFVLCNVSYFREVWPFENSYR